jgi:hypothetical protein
VINRIAIIVLALTGCTEVSQYNTSAKIVLIDGIEHAVVVPIGTKGEGVYSASLNRPGGSVLIKRDIRQPTKNIAAIEKYTGCKVLRETVINSAIGLTTAAVAC